MMAIAVLFTSCRIKTIEEKGPKVTKEIDQKDFDKIQVSGSAEIVFEQDSVYSIKVSATEKDMKLLKISVEDSTLIITNNNNGKVQFGKSPKYKLYITSPDMKLLDIAGAGDFVAKNIVTTDFTANIKGAGDIDIQSITAENINIDIRGAGDVEANLKDCGDVVIDVKGAGDVELSGNARSLTKHISGAGDIDTDHLRTSK